MLPLANQPTRTILALIAPQALIALCVVYYGAMDDHYFRSIPIKYQIASEAQSPKIVLVGGSSVAWGSDSETFSVACERPCVNLAVNAGQGNAFRILEAASFCKSGDALILSLEYNELSTRPYGEIVAKTILYSPTSARFLRGEELKAAMDEGVLENMASRSRMVVTKIADQYEEDPFYRSSNFNALGDFVVHQNQPPSKAPKLTLTIGPAATTYLERLKTFDQQCQARGVTIFYRLPCVPRSAVEDSMVVLEKTERQLQEIFGDRMLNRLSETLLPDDRFFDTAYHLVYDEKVKISKGLAARLSEKLTWQ